MGKIVKWLCEVLHFMCLNYILPMFVFFLVDLISGNSKIAFVLFSISLILGLVMDFKEMEGLKHDKNSKDDC